MVNDVFLGWDRNTNASLLERKELIVEGLAPFINISSRSKYFTINVEDRIGPDYRKDQLFVELYRNNDKYEIFVHDPRFFTLSWISVAFPFLYQTVVVNRIESHFYEMVLTEVHELDLAQDPCNEDKKYIFQVFILLSVMSKLSRFQACVSKSITTILGCKLKWEPLAFDISLPNCTTVAQFRYILDCPNICCLSVAPQRVQ